MLQNIGLEIHSEIITLDLFHFETKKRMSLKLKGKQQKNKQITKDTTTRTTTEKRNKLL